MSESLIHPVPAQWREHAWINKEKYSDMYRQSIEQPDQFWAEQAAEFLSWDTPWDTVSSYNFSVGEASSNGINALLNFKE